MNKVQLTQQGLNKLQKELDLLKNVKRNQAVERLHRARAMGDLSENSEYTAAKEDLAFIEGRIQEIETLLKNVEVVKHVSNGHYTVLGSTIDIEGDGKKDAIQIVGEFEADPLRKKLSSTSPIGKALLNKKVGEVVKVQVPDGNKKYKILDIK